MSQQAPNDGQHHPDALQPGAADLTLAPLGLAASAHAPAGHIPQPHQQPPAPFSWSPQAPFDIQGASGGGRSAGTGQTGAMPPANPASDAAPFPFPLNSFPGVPLGSTTATTMFAPQLPPMIAPAPTPQDVWQAAYSTTMNNIQQVYKDRVTELTHHNVALESDCQALCQELGDLQRRVSQAEAAQQQAQAELDATNHQGRYHPYGQEARRTPASPTVPEPGHDPSVENHPRSAWYGWFRSSAAGCHPPVLPNENTEWLPDLPLPGFALKCMGLEAERCEDERVEQAIRDKTAKRVTPTPLHDDYQPPDFGPWGLVDITTINQAHNLRHCGVHGRDLFAARLYCHLIVVYQADPTARREQGIAYLLRSWSADASCLPFERGSSNSTTRRNERKQAQKAAECDTIPAGTTPSPTTVPAKSAPAKSHPVDLSSIHWVPAAVIPSEAWGARALSGLQRQLDVSMKVSDVVKAFAIIPTSRWPLAMRDANGLFPSREGNVFCTPNEGDALAEVFITSILPVIPATFTEKYAESAFFRGVIELFSLRELYPWIFEHGKYDELLVEEPSPYPYDCTNLGLHHVVAWAHCCGIGNHSSLRDAIHTYAFNTRHRLEGRHSGELPPSFTTFPMRMADILKPVNIPLITSADTLFNLPKTSYRTTDASCGTAVPTTMVKVVPAPTEDVTMWSMSPVPN